MLSVDVDVKPVSPPEPVEYGTEALLLTDGARAEVTPPVADHPVVGQIRGVVVAADGSVVALLEFP